MKKVLTVVLITVMLFSGCSGKMEEENSIMSKSTAETSAIAETTVALDEVSYLDSSSNISSYEIEENPSISHDVYGEDIFSDYTAPYPPYEYFGKFCTSIQEVKDFIATTDGVNYMGGYYYSFLKMAREKGYMFEPFYNGESVFTGEIHGKYNKNGVSLKFEERLFGVGFGFYVETDKIQSELGVSVCRIYYLKDEWIEDAKEHPFNYSWGKPSVLNTFEKAQKIGWKRKKMTINGEEKQVYFDTYQMNTNHPVAELVYFHEDCIVNIELSCQPEEYIFGVAENIRFEKIWL